MAIIKVITPSVTDANITTAKVTDNAITLAKMASGTDGNIISYDASGNPVAIATGSDGQVLTSTGAGSPPAFEAVPTADFGAVGEHLLPSANDTYDLGSASKQWRNIYTGDLHLSNEAKTQGNSIDGTKGNWTIQEGLEELYILNNKSGKKYKFKLEEII